MSLVKVDVGDPKKMYPFEHKTFSTDKRTNSSCSSLNKWRTTCLHLLVGEVLCVKDLNLIVEFDNLLTSLVSSATCKCGRENLTHVLDDALKVKYHAQKGIFSHQASQLVRFQSTDAGKFNDMHGLPITWRLREKPRVSQHVDISSRLAMQVLQQGPAAPPTATHLTLLPVGCKVQVPHPQTMELPHDEVCHLAETGVGGTNPHQSNE